MEIYIKPKGYLLNCLGTTHGNPAEVHCVMSRKKQTCTLGKRPTHTLTSLLHSCITVNTFMNMIHVAQADYY